MKLVKSDPFSGSKISKFAICPQESEVIRTSLWRFEVIFFGQKYNDQVRGTEKENYRVEMMKTKLGVPAVQRRGAWPQRQSSDRVLIQVLINSLPNERKDRKDQNKSNVGKYATFGQGRSSRNLL